MTLEIFNIRKSEAFLVQKEGHYKVDMGGFILQLYFKPSLSKKALIFSPGFIDRAKFPNPYFQRVKWLKKFDAVGISLADPTLDLNEAIEIGWFLGTIQDYYLRQIAEFLQELLNHLEIRKESTLFFGSSAGGFSSLAFAAYIRGSCAFAVNPQTNILKFHGYAELAKISHHCFKGSSAIGMEKNWKSRLCISTLYTTIKFAPRIMIWQNTADEFHYSNHFIPFLRELEEVDCAKQLSIELHSNSILGHTPPGLDILNENFELILKNWL